MAHEAGRFLIIHGIRVCGQDMLAHLQHSEGVILSWLFPAGEVTRVVAVGTPYSQTRREVEHGILIELNCI